MKVKTAKPIHLDGRSGEGGGQLVRVAVALAAVTGQAVRVADVRANRDGGGGLKAQHVSAIRALVEATNGDVQGLSIGSKTIEFSPALAPSELEARTITIIPEQSASSALLVFQCVFPFLLFASNGRGDSIALEIQGGTNTSFSPSFDYLDQVLLPTLESRFGVRVERELVKRGWNAGPAERGCIRFKVQPLARGATLRLLDPAGSYTSTEDFVVKHVDATILVPQRMLEPLQNALVRDIGTLLPDAEVNFVTTQDSGHDARMYVLLVARSESGLRWGRDLLFSVPKKQKNKGPPIDIISQRVSRALFEEVLLGGQVDVYLQDQLIIFQALAEGDTSFPRGNHPVVPGSGVDGVNSALSELHINRRRRDKVTAEPFGSGSLHSKTVRWVCSELLPAVKWYDDGATCEGVGIKFT